MSFRHHMIIPLLLLCTASLRGQDIDPPLHGYIEIASEPRGAEVFLGDSLLGTTPMRLRRSLARDVLCYFPSRDTWNGQVRALPEELPDAQSGVVILHFDREILLRSLPHGAAVFRGDSLLGYTPLRVDAEGGPLRVDALHHTGVDWDPGSVTRSEYLLILTPSDDATAGNVSFHGNTWRLPPADVLLPAGVGLLAGIAAVILKQKADAEYEEYLATGEEELLSQTKKYDIYAGISLALLQLGLGYFIYRLFDE